MISRVVPLRDVADAGRVAAVDVVVEARDSRVPARLRPLARTEAEDAVQDVERLAHLLRVRVRAEVEDAAPVTLAREHHARELLLDRERDVGERLVVAQAHVERRPVPLHEVLLEVERLDLGARDDHLDVVDALRQLRHRRRGRGRAPGSTSARAGAATSPSRRTAAGPSRRGRRRHPASWAAPSTALRRVRTASSQATLARWAGSASRCSRFSRLSSSSRPASRAARRCASASPRTRSGRRRSSPRRPGSTCSGSPASTASGQRDLGARADGAERGGPPALDERVSGAALAGLKAYVSVSQFGSATTPLTEENQDAFAQYTAAIATAFPALAGIIVGNEPNINRFWLPQFNPDGTDAAAPAYEKLLAKTYDAVKAAQPRMQVIGAALSPHGGDNPGGARPTHSPTVFIRDLGAAFRASGRTTPIMDVFVYPSVRRQLEPVPDRRARLDDDRAGGLRKLVTLLGQAFDGTAQPGSTLQILYDEYGVESQDPPERHVALLRQRADDDQAGRRGDAGRVLHACAADRVLPAERRRPAALPRVRRERPQPLAVGPLLREPDRRSRAWRRCETRRRLSVAASPLTATGCN